MSLVGEAARVKSANSTDSESVAVVVLELEVVVVEVVLDEVDAVAVPVTVKLIEDEVTAVRFPTVSVLDCPEVMEEGLKEQVAGETFAQPRTIESVYPELAEAETVNFAWPVPISTVSELGSAERVKSADPVPVRVIVCGEPRPESVIVNVPTLVPTAEGAKLMLMVQLAPAFTTLPQVLVSE